MGAPSRVWGAGGGRGGGGPPACLPSFLPPPPPVPGGAYQKKMAELDPAANPGAPVIPQLLAKDGALAAWMIGELRKMGYTEVNLNFGIAPPALSPPKARVPGCLRDLSKLEAFLDEVFSQAEGPISVKTRLGVTSPEEFEAILDLYDRYPICELTVHPGSCASSTGARPTAPLFAKYLPHCRMPVCYNGDITTPAQLKALEAEFPNLSGIMVGRGHHRRPGPAAAGCGRCARFEGRTAGLPRRALPRLHRGLRHGQLCRQPDEGPLALPHPAVRGLRSFQSRLRKAREGWEYEVVVNQLFTLPLL